MCSLEEEGVHILSEARVLNGCNHVYCLPALDAHFWAVNDLAPA